jgi:hypothetical protein
MMAFRIDAGSRIVLRLANVLVVSALLSGCNIGCWFAPCDQALDVVATVADPSGAPLQGVRVEVLGHAGETDSNGCLELDGVIHSSDVILRVDKRGYKTYEESKGYDFYRINITLEPTGSHRPSTATWKPLPDSDSPPRCGRDAPER